jgi:hypothetical protein
VIVKISDDKIGEDQNWWGSKLVRIKIGEDQNWWGSKLIKVDNDYMFVIEYYLQVEIPLWV